MTSPDEIFTTTWAHRMLALAAHVATWSKDPSTKVGAVIVRPDRTIASVGYNGFPRGVPDRQLHLDHRPTKYKMIVHAEINAILNAHEVVAGCHIFATPLFYCSNCAATIIQAGIVCVHTGEIKKASSSDPDHDTAEIARMMFNDAGVKIKEWKDEQK